jgi:SPP1 gp7 family putative phage head morphogenesis protein
MPEKSEKPDPFAWKQPWKFADVAKEKEAREGFTVSRAAERAYERQLRSVAERIRTTLETAPPEAAEKLLRQYADIIGPWAKQSAANMLAGVERKNRQTWQTAANRMGLDMKILLRSPGVGRAVQERVAANMTLIKSLITGSADKVAAIVKESMATGERAEDLAKRIAEHVGDMSMGRARTIARTEVSKAGTALTQARAESVGSGGYIWRTARDGDTRPSHRAMEGKYVPWDKPVTLDNMTGHAGEFPNCRCYPEPVIPREGGGVYRPALPTAAQEKNAGIRRPLSQYEKEGGLMVPHVPDTPLHNVEKAFIPEKKLETYTLCREHQRGKHKAIRFEKEMGFRNTEAHRREFERQVLEGARKNIAFRRTDNPHPGEHFSVFMSMTGPNGVTKMVKTNWTYHWYEDKGEYRSMPHMSSAFIAKEEK